MFLGQKRFPESSKRDAPPDSRYDSLIKFVKWQGRILVLLAVALGAVLLLKKADIRLPSQEPVKTAPPLTADRLQYSVWAYQGNDNLTQGMTVTRPEVNIIGQIYDYQEIQSKWPGVSISINDADIAPSSYGNFQLNLALKPGDNIINSALIIDGKPIDSKQMTIIYRPTTTVSQPAADDMTIHAQL